MLVQPMLTRLHAAGNLNAMLQVALRDVVALPGAEFGNIQMWDGDSALVVVAQCGSPHKFRCSGARTPMSVETCCAKAARESRTVFLPNVDPAPRLAPFPTACGTFRSVLSLPLICADGRRIGVITAHFTNHYVPTVLETEALEFYCAQLADAITDNLSRSAGATAKSLNQQLLAQLH
jgi:GAF domain-containing protein